MNNFRRALLLATTSAALVAAFVPTAATAGSTTGKVKQLYAREDGLHLVILDANASGRPACAANQPYYIIKAEGSTSGQSQLAMLMSAYLTGRTVTIEGTDACTRWGDGEDINIVIFK